jgi:hypothetical protein
MLTSKNKSYSSRLILLGVLILLITTGCGINTTVLGNLNTTQTVVELSEDNFEIIDRVQGEASVRYFFGFGGLKVKALNDMAMADLLNKADLKGSRALINVTTERHVEWKFLVSRATVTVSAHVIEFGE